MNEELTQIIGDLEDIQDRLQQVEAINETADKWINCAGSTIDALRLVLHKASEENRS